MSLPPGIKIAARELLPPHTGYWCYIVNALHMRQPLQSLSNYPSRRAALKAGKTAIKNLIKLGNK